MSEERLPERDNVALTILELVEKYNIETQKQGDLYIGFCPFHADQNRPNFTVYPHTNSYFCYTCGKGGDATLFYARMENISYDQANIKLNSNLQDLIDKINKTATPEESSYNGVTNLSISLKFRDFLLKYPELLSQVKDIMKDADMRLLQPMDDAGAITLFNDISSRLSKLSV